MKYVSHYLNHFHLCKIIKTFNSKTSNQRDICSSDGTIIKGVRVGDSPPGKIKLQKFPQMNSKLVKIRKYLVEKKKFQQAQVLIFWMSTFSNDFFGSPSPPPPAPPPKETGSTTRRLYRRVKFKFKFKLFEFLFEGRSKSSQRKFFSDYMRATVF